MRTFICLLLLLVYAPLVNAQDSQKDHGPFDIGSGIWLVTACPPDDKVGGLTQGYVVLTTNDTLGGYWLTKKKEDRNVFLLNKQSVNKASKMCNKNCSNIQVRSYYFSKTK